MTFWMCLVSNGGIDLPQLECFLPLSSAPCTQRPLQRYVMLSAPNRLRQIDAYPRGHMCYPLYVLLPSRGPTYTTSVCGVNSCSTKVLAQSELLAGEALTTISTLLLPIIAEHVMPVRQWSAIACRNREKSAKIALANVSENEDVRVGKVRMTRVINHVHDTIHACFFQIPAAISAHMQLEKAYTSTTHLYVSTTLTNSQTICTGRPTLFHRSPRGQSSSPRLLPRLTAPRADLPENAPQLDEFRRAGKWEQLRGGGREPHSKPRAKRTQRHSRLVRDAGKKHFG